MASEKPIKKDLTDTYREDITGSLKQIEDARFLRKLYYLILAYKNRSGL